MDPIEQAILTIKDHHKVGTGAIVAKTPGVRQIDEEELLGWAFDFEGDLPGSGSEPHLYFHPLPSGGYALGHLAAGQEADGVGISLCSHCLIVTPRLLLAFHNNILAIYQTLVARRKFHFMTPELLADVSSKSLSSIAMDIRHTPVTDTKLLESLRNNPGSTGFAQLMSLSVNSVCAFFSWQSPSIPLIHGIIQCLPITLRPELSFAMSLHFSHKRPLRLLAVRENSSSAREICQRFVIPFFHIDFPDKNSLRKRITSQQDWANFVYQMFDRHAFDFFVRTMNDKLKARLFATQRGTADWYLLNLMGKTLLEEWTGNDESGIDESVNGNEADANRLLRGDYSHERFQSGSGEDDDLAPVMEADHVSVISAAELNEIAQKLLSSSSARNVLGADSRPTSPSRLPRRFPHYERDIRKLDSLLARSLFGDLVALEALEKSWLDLRKRATFHEFEVIREAYIHLVQSIIVQPRDPEYPKPPRRTIDSLEVMNILLRE